MRFKTICSFAFTILFSAGCIVGATIVHADQMTIRAGGATSTVGFVPPPRQLGAFLVDTAEASLSMGMKGHARTYGGVTRYWRSAYSSIMLRVVSSSGKSPMTRSGSGHWNSSTHGFSISWQSDEYDENEWTRAYWVIKNNSSRVDWTASESADYKRTYDGSYLIAEESTTFSDEYTKEDLKADFLALPLNYKGVFTKTDAPSAARIYSTNGDAYSIVKLKYKIKPLEDYYGPIYWLEVFTPADNPETANIDESENKSYKFFSWLRVAGANESPEYIIDPLDASNHPDQNGSYEPVLLNIGLSVDMNRDGKIKLATEDDTDGTLPDKPYRFWINDDDDVDDDDPDDSEKAPVEAADYLDDKIDGIRDLEDFARLKIYLGGLQDAVLQGQIQIGLKWKDVTGSPSLKLWRNLSRNGGTEYLTDVPVARQHLALRSPGLVDVTTPYIISAQYWRDVGLSASQPSGNLLFEGSTVGKGQLVIVLYKADGTEIGEGPGVWIDLKNIKSMYERVKATADGAENFPFPYNFVGSNPVPSPTMGWVSDPNGYPFEPALDEKPMYIVSVHGWNQTYERATMYAETMFKRLWHRGYKGRFTRFRWPTFTGPVSYNDSEYRAWRCGVSLKQYLDTLPSSYTANLVAHSMGNIVAGSALEKGASVANYALLNAAVPAICYDTSGNVFQAGWGYVTPNDDFDSATVALSYQGRLSNVSGNLINFFLPADSALGLWELNNDSPNGGRYPTVGARPHEWPEGTIDHAGYSYIRTRASGQKLRVIRMAGERVLSGPEEAMAFCVQAPSLTAGADGRTRGSIDDWKDMTDFGFGSVHSAEFLFTIQQTRDFYGALLLKFGVAAQP